LQATPAFQGSVMFIKAHNKINILKYSNCCS
jgi:hypothetical protein